MERYKKKIKSSLLLLTLALVFCACDQKREPQSIEEAPSVVISPDITEELIGGEGVGGIFEIFPETVEDIESENEDLLDSELILEISEDEEALIEEDYKGDIVEGDTDGSYDDDEETKEVDLNCETQGNLISNGSFEIVDDRIGIATGKKLSSIVDKDWDVFQSLPSIEEGVDSWTVTKGSGIEIQGYNTVVKSLHGKRSVELDAHGRSSNSEMSQKVTLCKGRYVLKFLYYPRTRNEEDNTISVKLNDEELKRVDMTQDGRWHLIRIAFKVKESGTYKISFSAEGLQNTVGGLLDNIRLRRLNKRAGVITSLFALGDKDNREAPAVAQEIAEAIVSKMVNFASIEKKPNILLVQDQGHNGESIEDFEFIEELLYKKYGENKVKVIKGDLHYEEANLVDLIYVVNPGYPLKSKITANTLREIKENNKKIGIILSGDDMSRGADFALEDLTGVKYVHNGVNACDRQVDNNQSENTYLINLRRKAFRRVSKEERVLSYGNDIDHVEISKEGVKILAKAGMKDCDLSIPVIFGYKIK